MHEIKTTVRPTWDDEMRKELAQIVGKQVNQWCNNETPLEDCIETADKILQYHSNDNGYEIAREFEREGFSPDSDLVDILDSVYFDKNDILDKQVKKWVIENELKPQLVKGQKVIANIARKGEVECEVVEVYPDTMTYGLWYEGIGYIKYAGHAVVNCENILRVV